MKINFAHLCDYAALMDGKMTVVGIFSQIHGATFPLKYRSFHLAFELGLRPSELGQAPSKLKIAIQDEDGKSIAHIEGELQAQGKAKVGDEPKISQAMGFQNLTFERPCPHQVVFSIDGRVAHELRFKVVQRSDHQT